MKAVRVVAGEIHDDDCQCGGCTGLLLQLRERDVARLVELCKQALSQLRGSPLANVLAAEIRRTEPEWTP